jgi:hypothetical protein
MSGRDWFVRGFLTLAVLGLLAVALDSLAFSDASFTAGSSAVATVTAGDLHHANDHDGRLLIDAAGLAPGDVRGGRMSLTGLGDLNGRYTLSSAGLSERPSAPRLADTLDMTIVDETHGTSLYRGPVSGFSSVDLGIIGPGDARSYSLTLSYPEGDVDARLQGATLTLALRVAGVTP